MELVPSQPYPSVTLSLVSTLYALRRTRAPPSSPVLAYREIVEHPCLQPPNIQVIKEVLEAVTGEEKRKAEWRENAVPLEDPREDAHKAAEEEVRRILCLGGEFQDSAAV